MGITWSAYLHPELMDTILILGGYGAAGKALAEMLLDQTEVNLIIAGRNAQRAEVLAQDLRCRQPERDVQAVRADAADPASLRSVFPRANWVILTATVPEHAGSVARIALESGCHFMDILITHDIWPRMEALGALARQSNRYLITQAGFHPGLLAPLVRLAAMDFDHMTSAQLGMSMNFRPPNLTAASEIINEAYDYKMEIYGSERWHGVGWNYSRDFDFGPPAGRRSCVPMTSLELLPLPHELNLESLGAYVSGFNWFVDNVVFPLTYLLGRIRKGLGLNAMLHLFKWGMDNFAPAEGWTVVQLEAEGRVGEELRRKAWRLRHEDGYFFTAACVLAGLRQAQEGQSAEPGCYPMGLFVEPRRLWEDLLRCGLHGEQFELMVSPPV